MLYAGRGAVGGGICNRVARWERAQKIVAVIRGMRVGRVY